MITWAIVYLLTHSHPEWVGGYFLGWAIVADVVIFIGVAENLRGWFRL